MLQQIFSKENVCKTCRERFWLILKLVCLLLVIIQTLFSVSENFFSGKTITSSTSGKLEDIEFPLVLNVVVTPGFNQSRLIQEGFKDVYQYFKGRNQANRSVVGWANQQQQEYFKNATG